MRIHRGFLGWGLFFVVLGLVPLSVQAGWVARDQVSGLWRLWPLFLIAGGLGLVLMRTRFAGLGGLLAAVTAGLMLGGLLATGAGIGIACGPPAGAATVASRTGTLVPGSSVSLDVSCGRATVTSVAGSQWQVAWGPHDNDAPRLDTGTAHLGVASPGRDGQVPGGFSGSIVDVAIPRDVTRSVAFQVNAGSASIPLDGLALDDVHVQSNAADTRIDLVESTVGTLEAEVNVGTLRVGLPAAGLRTARLQANLAQLVICAPPELALRVMASGALVGWDLPGLTKVGDAFVSPGFSDGTGTTVVVSGNLSNVRLERGGTCR